jgi:CheY-like chemotaxis protein
MRFSTLRDRDGRCIGAYQFVYDVTSQVRDQERRAVARGTDLTRHLLAFSRRHPVNPASVNVSAQLNGMRAMLDGSLGGHIDVQMNLPEDVWPVELDAGELELAILNLCLNARDAMAGGGVITITAGNTTLRAEDGSTREFVRVSIADTGHGIPPEIQARVFEPFFTTKDISKGSGLGLPQVYGFAQQSAGRVEIASEVGVGTIVTLLLPRSHGNPVAARAADAAGTSVTDPDVERHGQVLLVEDDREVAALTREVLSSLGCTVIHVASAEAALGALANSRQINFVLSDIMMPGGVSGLELAREIRRRRPEIAVVLTTGYVEALADMREGEFEVLLKPFTVEALADALRVEATHDLRRQPD